MIEDRTSTDGRPFSSADIRSLEREIARLREELASARQAHANIALESSDVGSWHVDISEQQLSTDERFRTIFGVTGDQLSLDSAFDIIHVGDRQRIREAVEVATEPGIDRLFDEEYRVVHPNGAIRWVVAKGRANFQVDGVDVVAPTFDGTISDISERKWAALESDEQGRNKDSFLAMLGHELRNPLSGVVSGVEALRHIGYQSADATELCNAIARESDLMTRLVDDLLDMSRVSAGKIRLQLRRINLVETIRRIVEDHRHHTEKARLTMTCELPDRSVWLDGDLTRISQVVKNLLNNATKFSEPGGTINVRVTTEGREVSIVVADTGFGMTPATIANLFEPFHQAENSVARSRGGLGLGMALSKRLVELHGGEISGTSEGLGSGSEFTVILALSPDQVTEAKAVSVDEKKVVGSHRILVVDDQETLRLPMRQLLTLLGQEVVADVETGSDALAAVRKFDPEIVVCDIGLPDMTGYKVAQEIRLDADRSDVYLVALTGYGQDDDRKLAQEAGFDLHITKPINRKLLQEVIDHCWNR